MTQNAERGNRGESEADGTEGALLGLFEERQLGVLVTLKRDGRPQASNVVFAYDAGRRILRVSTTADRAKSRNLSRDPRAAFHVTRPDGWAWAVAEGDAEVTPPAREPGDATVEELVEVYRAIGGEHPDWDEYRAAMVAERRQVVRLPVRHVYGQPPRARS